MKSLINEVPYISPWDTLRQLPDDSHFIFLGGSSEWSVLALGFKEINSEEALSHSLHRYTTCSETVLPFVNGLIGALAYDDFSCKNPIKFPKSRIFEVSDCLVFNNSQRRLYAIGSMNMSSFLTKDARDTPQSGIKSNISLPQRFLKPDESDESFLSKIETIKNEIRAGRYYQLNLIRYFKTNHLPKEEIINRLQHSGGPYASWFKVSDLEVISFSPEQFIQIRPTSPIHSMIITRPIKGSAPRLDDPEKDRLQAKELQNSGKDLAELHMIVDLLRNDLNKIAIPHSVKVIEAHKLKSFTNIHHLEACIEAQINPDITLRSLFKAVCPGGSITGAPKIEVMKAISELERRDRGFFMGNVFYLSRNGHFNSSILIRTLVREGNNEMVSYAAGGGITIRSDAMTELREVEAKCKDVLCSLI